MDCALRCSDVARGRRRARGIQACVAGARELSEGLWIGVNRGGWLGQGVRSFRVEKSRVGKRLEAKWDARPR